MTTKTEKNSEYRKWNTEDFYGKYHISKIKNQISPIPGTQINIELGYIRRQEQEKKKKEKEDERRNQYKGNKLRIMQESAGFRARVYVAALVADPLQKTEEILRKKEMSVEQNHGVHENVYTDEILRFFKNVKLGKAQYIGFAMVSGYKYIDWQDPEFGNTALHLAASLGHVDVVKELLKYKAKTDIRNRIGDFPIHQCWMFWQPEKSIENPLLKSVQEQKTCAILSVLLFHDAFPDCLQLDGSSPLHTAAKLGAIMTSRVLLPYVIVFNNRALSSRQKLAQLSSQS